MLSTTVESAVNNLSGLIKLSLDKPPDSKSVELKAIARVLEYGFEVTWHRIILSKSTTATIIAGRFFDVDKSEKGKLLDITCPTVNVPMLCLPQASTNLLLKPPRITT